MKPMTPALLALAAIVAADLCRAFPMFSTLASVAVVAGVALSLCRKRANQ